jgi:catechol 2,3-dioxygenase-like lactoylglutathione lyase family enzyme
MAPLARLDHVVIAVANLDVAAAAYRKFGFTLTPRGLHEGKGTGNNCIMFGSTYIELLGVVDASGAEGRLAQRVTKRGEGGIAIAYGADDADKVYRDLRAAGVEAEAPNDLARPLELDGKREMVRFRNVMMPGLTLPETMQFVCTHQTPELTRARHEWQLHPSGATGVAKIIVGHDKPHDALGEFAALFGENREAVQLGVPGQADAMLDNAKIAVQSRAEIEKTYGKDALAGAPWPGIVGLEIRVNEVDAVGAMLDMGRVPHRETKHGVIVPASAAHGVFLEFAEG